MRETVKIEKLASGEGVPTRSGETVVVHYTGWLTDGSKFDSSHDRAEPFSFTLGVGEVIAGWDEGILDLRVGDKARLTIPPELAYGRGGVPGVIPENAVLVFEVEVLRVGPA